MLHKNLVLDFSSKLKIHKSVFCILFSLIISLSFLGTANFLGLQGQLILASSICVIAYIILKGKLILNIKVLLSILFAIAYSLSVFLFTRELLFTAILYTFTIVLLVELYEIHDNKRKLFFSLTLAYALGLLLSFVLISIRTYWVEGTGIKSDNLISFWEGVVVSRTGMTLLAISAFGICCTILMFKNKFRTWYTIPMYLLVIFFVIFISLRVGNRSAALAFLITAYLLFTYKNFCKESSKLDFYIYCLLTILLTAGIVLFALAKYKVITIPESLMDFKIINRIFVTPSDDGRKQLYVEFFHNFYKYPFGGLNHVLSRPFVHNLFLDFYTYGGFPSFIILVAGIVMVVKPIFVFYSRPEIKLFDKGYVFAIVVGIISIGLLEPIYHANANCVVPAVLCLLYICSTTHDKKFYKKPLEERGIQMGKARSSVFHSFYYFCKVIVLKLSNKNVRLTLSAKVKAPKKNIAGYNIFCSRVFFDGKIGYGSVIGPDSRIVADIGNYVSIGPNVKTVSGNHPIDYFSTNVLVYSNRDDLTNFNNDLGKVTIGNDVWIGENVILKGGIKIGDGAIIGMGSVVVKDVEPYTIVAGNPAKEIKKRFTDEEISKIKESSWWETEPEQIRKVKNPLKGSNNE